MDGATTVEIPGQVVRLPRDATHLALSVGGNDALSHLDLLSMRVSSMAHAWDLIHSRLMTFERNYINALAAVLTVGLPTTVCTIYNGNLPDEAEARRATVALGLFNDVIVRAAINRRCPLVELRLICTDSEDYANPIEPSGQGGAKIARALARAVGAISEAEPSAYNPYGRCV